MVYSLPKSYPALASLRLAGQIGPLTALLSHVSEEIAIAGSKGPAGQDAGQRQSRTEVEGTAPVANALSKIDIAPLPVALSILKPGAKDRDAVATLNRECDLLGAAREVRGTPLEEAYRETCG